MDRHEMFSQPRFACLLFKCKMRKGHFCCAECDLKATCEDPCENSPRRCGWKRPQDKPKEVNDG